MFGRVEKKGKGEMPRPGPRPYECVRRAWHSDRHQPIRGSLIKEIFRFFYFIIIFFSIIFLLKQLFWRFFFWWGLGFGDMQIVCLNMGCLFFLCLIWGCFLKGLPTRFTARLPSRTKSGKRSSLLLSSKLKKSCTLKPILRYFSLLNQSLCFKVQDLFFLDFIVCLPRKFMFRTLLRA